MNFYHLLYRIGRLCFWSLLIFSFQVYGQSFTPGKPWKDTDGDVINAHGGGVLYHGGVYYWFGEHRQSGKEGFSTQVGVRCYSSQDLYQWKNEGVALQVVEDPDSEIVRGCNIERPKVIFNEETGKFVMWFHLELKDQGYAAAKTAVAISDNPTGPYKFIRSFRPNAGVWPLNFESGWEMAQEGEESLQWWTSAWRDAVSKGLFVRRDFQKGQMSRDMTLFVDDDGTAYHIHSAEENLTLHISELTPDYLDFTERYVVMEPAGHNEAPAVFKIDDTYYLITSGCTGWKPNAARSFKATSMFGPWESMGSPCIGQGSDITFQAQSTCIFSVHGSDHGFIFMADRWKPSDLQDSRYVWLPVSMENAKPKLQWREEWTLEIFDE